MIQPKNWPKIQSPFVRTGDPYVVTPEINPGYEWVFADSSVRACDKVDGTPCMCSLLNGKIIAAFSRFQKKMIERPLLYTKSNKLDAALTEGIANALSRGWLAEYFDGDHYGELIGPSINANRHQVPHHLWVPFKYLYEYCHWHSWVQGKYPKTFEAIEFWFKDEKLIPSLFNKRMKLPEIPAEGVVFTHPDGRMAKLRRDMFSFYTGERHKDNELNE
jgi:hypothetical protein